MRLSYFDRKRRKLHVIFPDIIRDKSRRYVLFLTQQTASIQIQTQRGYHNETYQLILFHYLAWKNRLL